MTPEQLTAGDRYIIAAARRLTAVKDADAVREHTGQPDTGDAYAIAFGEAQALLAALLRIIDRDGE